MEKTKFEGKFENFQIAKEAKIKLSISAIYVAEIIDSLQYLNETFTIGLRTENEDGEIVKVVIKNAYAKNTNFSHEGDSKLDIVFDFTKVDLNLLGKLKDRLCTIVCLKEEGLS